jgi:hypothetical protein
MRSGSIMELELSEPGPDRFECDLTWRTMGGFGDLSAKVERDGEGVAEAECPVKASALGKTMVEGLLPALFESNMKPPSFLPFVRPPQLRRIL